MMKDESMINTHKQIWKQYIVITMVILILYMITRVLQWDQYPVVYKVCMGCGLMLLAGYMFVRYKHKKIREEDMIKGILIAGCIMRIGYMLYTPCEVRAHDLGEISEAGYGHAAYLLGLILHGRLPETNWVQFYQQPFYYILAGAVSKCVNGLLGTRDLYSYVSTARIVSCVSSCYTLILSPCICDKCRLGEHAKRNMLLLVAFCPTFFLIGKDVNSDALIAFLMALAVYQTMCWVSQQSWRNTILLALTYGLGMMTKVSCAVLAIVTACMMLYQLQIAIKEKKGRELFRKLVVFGMISFPLGLWYTVRNYIKFRQFIFYVPAMGQDSDIYTGNISLLKRFVFPDWRNLISTPYADPWTDYNALVYYIKSSVFGEYSFTVPDIIPWMLLFFACALSACAVVCLIQVAATVRQNTAETNTILAFTILLMMSYTWFYMRYPYGCSMDFRYMAILIVLFGVLLGMNQNRMLQRIVIICLPGYAASACLMHLLI